MHLDEVLKIVEVLLAVTLIAIHFNEVRKRRSPSDIKTLERPSFLIIGLTLLFLVGITLIIINIKNPSSFEVISTHRSLLISGIGLTISVSLISICVGTIIGVFAALLLAKSKHHTFSIIVDSVIMSLVLILLGIPALVLLYLTYYSSSQMQSLFLASVIALSINLSPFVAKIVSASIRNISPEQITSAVSFGYTPRQITRYFRIGFVIRTSLQPLLVEYYTTIKLSSFAGLIGLGEIYHASQEIIKETQDPMTSYVILASCYVCIVTPFAILADYLEQKWKQPLG